MSWLNQGVKTLHQWLGEGSPATRTHSAKKRCFVPRLEQLEDRSAPSAATTDVIVVPPKAGDVAPFSPVEIRTAYGVTSIKLSGGVAGTGAGETIAIVDAYNDPDATSNLKTFDSHFGQANPPSFKVLNQNGVAGSYPPTDPTGDWELEESLDIEWAHSIAPKANIVLVEANSNSFSDLFTAEKTAASLSGVVAVSNSWSGGEFSGETSDDSIFTKAGVTFTASTGDSGSPSGYPAYSPYVVAVGGTSLTMKSGDLYSGETAWSGSGGGLSVYETRPSYQASVKSVVGSQRGVPDVSFDADPYTGVSVYDTFDSSQYGGPWIQVGGTSLSSPCWAALIAIADQGRALVHETSLSSLETHTALYSLPTADFHDITTGGNGTYNAGPGYDLVTGIGSPIANLLVPGLAAYVAVAGTATSSGSTPAVPGDLTASPMATPAAAPAIAAAPAPVQVGAGVWVYPSVAVASSTSPTTAPAVNSTIIAPVLASSTVVPSSTGE